MLSDPNVQRRFLDKIAVGDDCWEWTGARSGGYGRFSFGGRIAYAHRIAYEIWVGPIPEGLQIDHLCRNRACVRPDHLEPVTHKENILRGVGLTAKHAVKTHCPHGHLYDGRDNRGKRICRRCRADAKRRHQERKREEVTCPS